jgi:hypothetical protein
MWRSPAWRSAYVICSSVKRFVFMALFAQSEDFRGQLSPVPKRPKIGDDVNSNAAVAFRQTRLNKRDLPLVLDSRSIAFFNQCRAFCSATFASAALPSSR